MTEDIKKNLSKCKYVYRIYKENYNFHIEKYPIVYINSEVVYYKHVRKNDLERMNFNNFWKNIKESFDAAIEYINNLTDSTYRYTTSVYFVETDKLKEFDLSLIKKRLNKESKESKIKKQELEVEMCKNAYELQLRILEDMKKELGIEGGESDE